MGTTTTQSGQRIEQAPSSHNELSLIELLQVTPTSARDTFSAKTETYGPVGLYGGHFLGQAMAAGLARQQSRVSRSRRNSQVISSSLLLLQKTL